MSTLFEHERSETEILMSRLPNTESKILQNFVLQTVGNVRHAPGGLHDMVRANYRGKSLLRSLAQDGVVICDEMRSKKTGKVTKRIWRRVPR